MKRSVTAMMVLLTSMLYAVFCQAQILGTGQLAIERRAHTATLLQDGKVLIVGGDNQNGMVGQAEVFDPVAQSSSPGPSLATARTDHTATRLDDGRVLVIGGRYQNSSLTSTEIYNPLTATFTAGSSLTTPRSGHTATVLSDGQILIAGGDASASAELYNPLTENFSLLAASMNTGRKFHSAILTSSGQVLIVGGVNAQNTVLNTAEVFDPTSQSFYLPPTDMQTLRALATLKLLADGKVQIIGGDVELSMEVFDPTDGIFIAKALLPPNADLLGATLSTQSRAALFSPSISQDPLLQGVLTPEQSALLDRADQSITELPLRNQALVAGGINRAGQILNSAKLVSSSSASITTDKTDYAPGQIVTITGSGFQPNEQVDISFHEFPEEYPDVFFSAIANQQGNFVTAEFAPQEIDLGRIFTLTAIGQSSGFTAQTTFHDANKNLSAATIQIREATCTTAQASFTSGTTVCARVSATIAGSGGDADWSIRWFDPSNVQQRSTGFSSSANTTVTDTFAAATVGTWTVTACDKASNSSCAIGDTKQVSSQTFTVTAAGPTKLAITSVNGGTNPTYGDTFSVVVQSQNASSVATNVTANTNFTLSVATGTGTIGGTVTGTILSGQNTATVTGVTYSKAENGVSLIATRTSGNTLTAGTSASFNVLKAPLTVTADNQSRDYGAANPTLTATISGFANSETLATSGVTGTASCSTTATATSPASPPTYPITCATGSLASNNYTFSFVAGAFTINKKAASVTPNTTSKFYGSADPAFSGTLTGFLAADGVTATYSRTAGETVAGSPYTISAVLSPAGVLGNYDITSNTALFTIKKRAITVTADAKSKIYGEADPALTYQVTTGSLAFSDAFMGVLSRVAGELVGTYAIQQNTLSINNIGNYNLAYVGAQLTITTGFAFNGFYSPIGGSVENYTGGSFANPLRAFKLGSTVPVKFGATWLNGGAALITGIHTLQAIKYSSATDSEPPIDATPTDAATTGNEFRLTSTDWHFNLSTKGGFSIGKWLLIATLQDGSKHSVWITIKK